MKTIKLIGIPAVVVIAVASIWYFGFTGKKSTYVLDTTLPVRGSISKSVMATGRIQPVDTVSVGTQVSGTIKAIYADFNQSVKKGELVAELDKSLLEAQVNVIKANLSEAQFQLTYQKSNFDRQSLLYDKGAISKANYETALFQFNNAKAQVESVSAQLSAAERNLSYASIYSPVDGVVLSRNVNLGQTVAASFNTPTLFVIAKDIRNMQVQANVDEADIGYVKPGQRATFTVDAFPTDSFAGTVQQIRLHPSIAANVVTYTTIILARNDELKLKPGMTANVSIYTQEVKDAMLVPVRAIRFQPDPSLIRQYVVEPLKGKSKGNGKSASGAHRTPNNPEAATGQGFTSSPRAQVGNVWVKEGDSIVEKQVRTGMNDDVNVQIMNGLSEKDQVITGIRQEVDSSASSASDNRSPFLPRRPSRKPATPRPSGQ